MDNDVFLYSSIQSGNTEYAVQDLVGEGTFSRVYQAMNVNTREPVVIKALTSDGENDLAKQCMEEMSIMETLKKSPMRDRYVGLIEAFQVQTGTYCLVMERLGTTLCTIMHNVGPLPMSMCRPIIKQIAQGAYVNAG